MAKLGTKKRPAVVRVQTEARAGEIMQLCESHGWQVVVGVEADQPEDISDVNKLLKTEKSPSAPAVRARPVSGNDYCPCGSGLKYKKCCGLRAV